MILQIHENSLHLFFICARSRAGGHHYLRKNSDDPKNNEAINTIFKIMGNVMSSVGEAKIGSTYINAQDDVSFWTCLIYMGHPQPPTKIQIDNATIKAFSKVTLKKKQSKAIDMRFYWIQYREPQGQFDIFLAPSKIQPWWLPNQAPFPGSLTPKAV